MRPFIEQFTIGIVPAGAGRAGHVEASTAAGFRTVSSWNHSSPGEKVTLKANPNYWEGKPALAGVVFKIVPDAMVRVLEFKQGAIDFMQNDLEPEMLPWLKRQHRRRYRNAPGHNVSVHRHQS